MVRPTDRQLAALALGAVGLLFAFLTVRPAATDFASFHATLTGATQPDRPNLNPPTLAVLLAPLGAVDVTVGFWIFTVASAVSVAASLYALRASWWLSIATTVSLPALVTWGEGQLTFLLLYPVTRAYLAQNVGTSPRRACTMRQGNPWSAGAWLACAIAIKPPLALFALLLPWRVWLSAGLGSAALCVATVPLVGLAPWGAWLALSEDVRWIEWPLNVSVFGVLARLDSGAVTGSAFRATWLLPAAVLLVPLGIHLRRQTKPRRWALALVWSLLASPLGWAYYLPLAAPALRDSWRGTPLARLGAALLCVPMPALALVPLDVRLMGSTYFVGVLALWAGLTMRGKNDDTTRGATLGEPRARTA